MNSCKKCGNSCERESRYCESCVQLFLKNSHSKYIAPKDDNLKNLGIFFFVSLFVFGLAMYPVIFGYGKLPEVKLKALNSYASDPCINKERCVIAYLAPWCPSCVASQGFLVKAKNKLLKNNKLGMKIIIGMADEASSMKMASGFDNQVFLDTQSEFSRAVGITSVPTVLIIDDKQTIVDKDLPAHLGGNMSEEELIDVWLTQNLKLAKYF
ncbi:MAG: redoxin family protein [Proteobacteria bacterium]|nr:redoxin family protein [Pseudomonadota bacterium]